MAVPRFLRNDFRKFSENFSENLFIDNVMPSHLLSFFKCVGGFDSANLGEWHRSSGLGSVHFSFFSDLLVVLSPLSISP